jgi:arginine decarboxylase
MGLECGSKAELVASLAHLESDATPLICNGYKDAVMLRLILAGQQIGKNVIPVIEKYTEFENFLRLARETLVRPRFGVRVKLGTGGAGKWADSGGDQSKFGISVPELVTLIERLKQEQLTDAFVLLHFHLGSQLSNIQVLKQAVKEITQVYAQLRSREVPVRYIDVGGGLGVNYDAGYDHNEDGAINYTLQEYANAVVYTVMEVCDEQEVVHPIIVSESGRALTAHHSVLIVESLGSSHKDLILQEFSPTDEDHTVVHELYSSLQQVQATDIDNAPVSALLEAYHDAVEKRHEAELHFVLGYLSIEQKALAERLYWTICTALDQRVQRLDPDEVELPAELLALDDHLVQQYLCDFSIFQSILDHWAIGQGFPIMPVHHLHEEPKQRAMLVDLTCDSDGKVSHYVSSLEDKSFLKLHDINGGEPYFLGFFLMGAYQDIMGDSHNLFGRVSEAHVYADPEEPNGYYIEKIIRGTTVKDMLEQVQYFSHDLHRRMNESIRQKIDSGVIRPKAGVELLNQYAAAFGESTYYNARDN